MESNTTNTTNKPSNIVGYSDTLFWDKVENDDGTVSRRGVFPISRYNCILNRPRVINEGEYVTDTPNANFHLLVTETEEVSDDTVFNLIGQVW